MESELIIVICPQCHAMLERSGKIVDGYAILDINVVIGVAGDNLHCNCGYTYKREDLQIQSAAQEADEGSE